MIKEVGGRTELIEKTRGRRVRGGGGRPAKEKSRLDRQRRQAVEQVVAEKR